MSHSSAILLWSSSVSIVTLKFCGAMRLEKGQLVTSFYEQTCNNILSVSYLWMATTDSLWRGIIDFTVNSSDKSPLWTVKYLFLKRSNLGNKTLILSFLKRKKEKINKSIAKMETHPRFFALLHSDILTLTLTTILPKFLKYCKICKNFAVLY